MSHPLSIFIRDAQIRARLADPGLSTVALAKEEAAKMTRRCVAKVKKPNG